MMFKQLDFCRAVAVSIWNIDENETRKEQENHFMAIMQNKEVQDEYALPLSAHHEKRRSR